MENYAYTFIHEELEEVFDMKFDVIIGNPPYQLETEGYGAQATPIYQYFIEKALDLSPRYASFILPARWFAGGMGVLNDFRERMINDRRVKELVDYPRLFEAFPGVEIKGGVCYFLWDRDHDGDCRVTTMVDGQPVSEAIRDLREGGGVLIRSNEGVSILEKVRAKGEETLESSVSAINPSISQQTLTRTRRGRVRQASTFTYEVGRSGYLNPRSPRTGIWFTGTRSLRQRLVMAMAESR